jgi:hypothetical protein
VTLRQSRGCHAPRFKKNLSRDNSFGPSGSLLSRRAQKDRIPWLGLACKDYLYILALFLLCPQMRERILTTDQFRLWTPSVVAYLAGKDMAFGADLAKAVGRSYGTMGLEDWRTLATIMKSLGWRSRRADGVQCWRPG